MKPSNSANQALHKKLPIDSDENVLEVYKHHWLAYAGPLVVTALMVIAILVLAGFAAASSSLPAQYHSAVVVGAMLLVVIVILGGLVPVYLMSQEQLVLTDESLLRVLQPTLFFTKVDELGLQHVADVSFSQDFMGSLLGYGKLTIETPGEQASNYEFYKIPRPRDAAQQINEQHENFDAALQGGRLSTTMGTAPPAAAPTIDPQEFQEFLEFQQMKKQQEAQLAQSAGQSTQSQGGQQPAPQNQRQSSAGYDRQDPQDPQNI